MAEAAELLNSTGEQGLVVWAVPKLRRSVQHAIDLWNTAIGRTWMTLSADKAAAQVHVLSKTYPGDAPHSGSSRADLGGQGTKGVLNVWINPDSTPDFLLTTITHELGHSLGLDDAYKLDLDNAGMTHRMSYTPSNRGTMSVPEVPPGPTEGAQARGDQGLSPPFYWSPEAQAAYQQKQGPNVSDWAKDFAKDGGTWRTAANLVASGINARGLGLGYSQSQFVQDVVTMARTLVPSNRFTAEGNESSGSPKQRVVHSTPAKKVPVGGGPANQKRE